MARVSINIVTWNSLKYLPEALESISRQTYRDFSVLIIDNASSDGTIEYVRSEHPEVAVLRNTHNLGFCRAHNQGIAYAKAHLKSDNGDPLILITNPDILLEPDFLERLVKEIDRRPEAGSAGGKLLKVYKKGSVELAETVKTDVIDTTGLKLFRSRRLVDRGAGETEAEGRYDRLEEVFGVSGAVALYRLEALDDAALNDEYFDEDFFAYKEDVDLAWRLRLRGWSALYVPWARAYHYRTAAGSERATARQIAAGRRGRSHLVNVLSYRNHWLTLAKDDFCVNRLLHLPWIVPYETGKFLYVLFLEPATLAAVPGFLRLWPKMRRKHRIIMKNARTKPKFMRRWMA